MPFLAVDQNQVAAIDEQAEGLAQDEDRVSAYNRIEQQAGTAEETQIPEGDRHNALAAPLGSQPLHDEATGEGHLGEQPDDDPCVEVS